MNKFFLTITLIGLFITTINAQRPEAKQVNISGKVVDNETRQPLEYATIAFYSKQQNKIVTGGITDIKGNFKISVPTGVYDISIEYISFKSQTITSKRITRNENLGTFSLNIDAEALEAVEIIAERTTVEIRLDKKIYNVGKDLTVSGGTVSDVLDNVPSVSVDAEGNVALRGDGNVLILINGKPSGLVGINSTDALQQLPAEAIEKVEVITSPSARYESEGTAGIINIILRRSKLQGLNGAITGNVGNPDAAGISGNVNYRTGDINFFNTSSYSYRESPGHSYIFTEFLQSGNFIDEKTDWTRIRKGLTTNLGLEWYLTDSASLTTSIVYSDSDNETNSVNRLLQFDENLILTGESDRLDPELNTSKTIQYSLNFTKDFEKSGHKLTFDFQYEKNDQDKFSKVIFNGLATDIVATIDDQTQTLLRSDYVLPIGENSQFEMGYRGDFDDKSTDYTVELLNESTNDFEVDTNLSNLFIYRQYINAAYIQFGSKIEKFSYLLGLRMENSQITLDQPTSGDFEKKNYTGLFPTINLNYSLSEDENITLGYSRRLRRPWSFFLNPFPSRTSLTNIFQGNPDLDPTYSGKFDLGYLNRLDKVTISSSLYYQHSINVMDWVSFETGDIVEINGIDVPVIKRSPVNLASNDRYGFELNLNYNPTKKWRINSDFNISQSVTKGFFNDQNFDSETVRWSVRVNNKLTLPGKIDWQTNMRYRGPSTDAQNIRKGTFTASMAFSKDLFKDKASIAFNIRDLLDSSLFRGDIETDTFFSTREIQYRGGRTFNLSFTYRFNQKKKRQRNTGGGDFEFEG
jgi:Outer membrane protein beta-barrel family/CarboxypepD_reg-like domain/TonB-dependent Receptor Plug Domain